MVGEKKMGGKVAAVAGVGVEDQRAIDLDDVSEIPADFLPVIQRAHKEMGPKNAAKAEETGCFGFLWKDEQGICEYSSDCDVSLYCQAVWDEVNEEVTEAPQKTSKPVSKPAPAKPTPEPKPPKAKKASSLATPVSQRETKVLIKPAKRGKYKGTGQYVRHGYFDMGRPVDQLIRVLRVKLGEPPVLPKNWNWMKWEDDYQDLGKITMAQTSSYHTFLVDGKTVCRFWTNAAGSAIVDLSALLVARARVEKVLVDAVSPKMAKKLAPCVGRIRVKNDAEADRLAQWIRQGYNLSKPKSPKGKK
jgi:hypothetical protein